jgi:hypothetical protein
VSLSSLRCASVALVLFSLAVEGCGDSHDVRVVAPRRVDVQDVQRQPSRSPQRAVLELTRAVQIGDAVAVVGYLTPAWPVTLARARNFLRVATPIAQNWGVPRIVRTARRGTRATVWLRVGRQVGVADLQRRAGRWYLARFRARNVDLPGDGRLLRLG